MDTTRTKNKAELDAKIALIMAALQVSDEYRCAGVRYEMRAYSIGDVVANSKDNFERSDERDFPKFGTPEYEALPELDGCSTYALLTHGDEHSPYVDVACLHAYVVVGDEYRRGEDDGEIIIRDGIVAAVLY